MLYGKRSTVAGYYEVAADHGFTYAPVDILDETGGMTLPVAGGTRLSEVELGAKYVGLGFTPWDGATGATHMAMPKTIGMLTGSLNANTEI